MTHIYTTIDIQALPDRVWAAVRDIEHWSEWTPTVISVRPLDPGPLAVGARAIVRQPKLLPARWQITELEEGRSFSWITRGPGISVTARHSIEGAPIGSRATLSLDFSGPFGPLCSGLTHGLNARYLAVEARGLKKRAEAEARSAAFRKLTEMVDGVERQAVVWKAVCRHQTHLCIYERLGNLTEDQQTALWGSQEFYRAYSSVN